MAVLTGVILYGVRCRMDDAQTVEMTVLVDPEPGNGGAFCDALRESSKVVVLQGKDRLAYLEWIAKNEDHGEMPSLP